MNSRLIKLNENLRCKMECELEYGSYKVRGVKNYFDKNLAPSNFQVLSAGNLASACVGEAKKNGVLCTAVVPDTISKIKEKRIKSLGGSLNKVPFLDLWTLVEDEKLISGNDILHPIHPDLIEGYGKIADEIVSEYQDCENIFLPYGLGGLALGIIRAKRRLKACFHVHLVEVEQYAPFQMSLKFNQNSMNEHLISFIEAMGAPRVLEFVFEELKSEIKDVVTVTECEVKSTIRDLFFEKGNKIEGAAGAALAGAKKLNLKNSVALLTGQNISPATFKEIINESHH